MFGYSDLTQDVVESVYKLDLKLPSLEWKIVSTDLKASIPRYSYGYASVESKFYMFGGFDANNDVVNSLVYLELSDNPVKSQITTQSFESPDVRQSHTLVILSGHIYLFGGENNMIQKNDLWKFDPETSVWTSIIAASAQPSPRSGHAADSQGHVLIVFGGYDGNVYLNDMYYYSALTNI